MGGGDQATRPDDAADQLLLADWPAAHMVWFRRAAGRRMAVREAAFLELRHCSYRNRQRQNAALPSAGTAGGGLYSGIARADLNVSLLRLMTPFLDMQIGDRIITLMAALVLVLQIAMVSQRWIVVHIRIFAAQSFFLAMIAATIAWFNHAPHIYIAAALTLVVKVILVPILFERLVERMEIHEEIEPIVNVPLSVLISGGLTLVGYVVAESFYKPNEPGLGHNALAVAISLFLIGFFTVINRRKALTQVLALLSLENGLFLAAISLTYGMPLIVEVGIFFDVLVAAMVLGILVYRIRETFESMDVSRLRRLRG